MAETDLRHEDEADVYKADVLAGHLTRMSDRVTFQYSDDYPRDAPPVALTLPVGRQPVVSTGGAVPPFFAGLLPEGRRLQAVVRQLKTSIDDDMSILLAVGSDMVGDVRVLPAGSDPAAAPRVLTLAKPAAVSFADFLAETFDNALGLPGVPGVQDKVSSSMLNIPVTLGGGAAIVKFGSPAYPLLVENEEFFLTMASGCGLITPRHSVIRDRDGVAALAVQRFDRQRSAGRTQRLAQEDAVQLAGLWPAAKYRMSTRSLFDTVTQHATSGPAAAKQLLQQFAFAYLTANGDLHGKNVSLYSTAPDIWKVTPAYDLVSTLPYGDDRMALEFEGRDRNITGTHFLAMSERFGLLAPVARRTLSDLADRAELWISRYDEIGFSEQKTDLVKRTSQQRLRDLRTV